MWTRIGVWRRRHTNRYKNTKSPPVYRGDLNITYGLLKSLEKISYLIHTEDRTTLISIFHHAYVIWNLYEFYIHNNFNLLLTFLQTWWLCRNLPIHSWVRKSILHITDRQDIIWCYRDIAFYIWHCVPNILLWLILCNAVGLPLKYRRVQADRS